LVTGELETRAPFFIHNRKLISEIEALEHKSRRPDVLVDDELIYAFYDQKIPRDIHNGAAFDSWRKKVEHANPRLLYLAKDDLMRHEASGITTDQFPPTLTMDNISFSLSYSFSPGKNDDGVTLTVPQLLVNQVSEACCEWLVPGLLPEKVQQLVKSLPQRLRRHLVPVPAFSAAFCNDVPPTGTPLNKALAEYIREMRQIDVPLDAFRSELLPDHLLMNFRVVDEHGRQLGMSRHYAKLRAEFAKKTAPPEVSRKSEGEPDAEDRFTSWSFGTFKETCVAERAGQSVTLYNGLVDQVDFVVIRRFETREEAQKAHRGGLRRLFMILFKDQVRYIEKSLPDVQHLAMLYIPLGTSQELLQQILQVTFERCCLSDPLPSTEDAFAARGKVAKQRLLLVAQEIARLVAAILTEFHALQKVLPQLGKFPQAQRDIQTQLDFLISRRFIADVDFERLRHCPRYLRAVALRIEKLRSNPQRDQQCMTQLQPLQQALAKLRQRAVRDQRIDEFAWMLQELRVSLFAQELKTPVIVSVKRLEKMLAGIRA
jgi:ATP-dependent helicase HrpA